MRIKRFKRDGKLQTLFYLFHFSSSADFTDYLPTFSLFPSTFFYGVNLKLIKKTVQIICSSTNNNNTIFYHFFVLNLKILLPI